MIMETSTIGCQGGVLEYIWLPPPPPPPKHTPWSNHQHLPEHAIDMCIMHTRTRTDTRTHAHAHTHIHTPTGKAFRLWSLLFDEGCMKTKVKCISTKMEFSTWITRMPCVLKVWNLSKGNDLLVQMLALNAFDLCRNKSDQQLYNIIA